METINNKFSSVQAEKPIIALEKGFAKRASNR